MKLIKHILSVGLIILICLILLEVLMIVSEPYLFTGMFQYDPDIGFRVRPYSHGSNRFGFNAQDFPLEKRPKTFRILIIGDSFNWVGGKNSNYTVFIDQKFRQYFGDDRVDVINVGYPGTHTGEQLIMLKKFALHYHPDLVFLGFFAGNDFYDADPHKKNLIMNDAFFDIDRRHELIFLGYPIIPKSRFICFVEQKCKIFLDSLKTRAGATFSDASFFHAEEKHLQFCNLRLHEQGRWQENTAYVFRSISDMEALLKERKIKFVVGIYPDEFQVNPKLFSEICQRYNLHENDYDVEIMQKLLHGFLDQKGIGYIDLLPEFKNVSNTTPLYMYQDTHWNEAGNRLAADIIFPELRKYTQPAAARP